MSASTYLFIFLFTPALWATEQIAEEQIEISDSSGIQTAPLKIRFEQNKERVPSAGVGESRPHIFDSYFLFNVEPEGRELKLNGMNFNDWVNQGSVNFENILNVFNIYSAATGKNPALWLQGSTLAPARTYEESLGLIKKYGAILPTEQRLALMSLLLDKAGAGYNLGQDKPKAIPCDQIWQNMKNDGQNGGWCGNIHECGGEYAKALGFTNIGSHTGLQANSKNANQAGGHVVLHFQDPATHEYYIQNYGQVIRTGQKTQTGMLDVSERVLGAVSTTVYTENQLANGKTKVNLYQPRTSRWIENMIQNASAFKGEKSSFRAQLSKKEQTFVGEVTPIEGKKNLKAYFIHSRYQSEDGPVSFDAVGTSGGLKGQRSAEKKMIDQMGYAVTAMFGVSQIKNPIFSSSGTSTQAVRKNYFVGTQIKGYARINKMTGKLEVKSLSTDLRPTKSQYGANVSAPSQDISAGVKYQANSKVSLEGSRHWEIVPNNLAEQKPKIQTAYDKFDVVIDTRDVGTKEKKIYLVSDSQVFILGGLESNDAVGVRQKLEAVIPKGQRGTFTIIGDASKMLANPSANPFYETPSSARATVDWKKTINKAIEVGASGTVSSKNQPFYLFEESSTVRPDLNETQNSSNAQVYLRIVWK